MKSIANVQKAVVLAAGESTRFWPLANSRHKALYRCGLGTTLLEQTVLNLLENCEQLKEVIVVISPKDLELVKELFEDNSSVRLVVMNRATGEGNAILLAKEYLSTEEAVFITSADKVNAYELLKALTKIENESIAVRTSSVSQTYGLIKLNINRRIVSISEKPSKTQEFKQRITSAYLLSTRFLSYLEKHKKEHYSLEAALNRYIKDFDVHGVLVDEIPEVTLKFPWHLLTINQVLLKNLKSTFVDPEAEVSKTAKITGPVFIESGAKIMDFAKIAGPVYIGKNAVIGDYTSVRENSFIDEDVVVGSHSEVKNSIIYKGTHLHRNFIGDSVLDEDCKIGAGAVFANKRIDRKEILSRVKKVAVPTGQNSLGAVLGKEVNIGVNVSLMPGVKLGAKASVYPNQTVFTDVLNEEEVKS